MFELSRDPIALVSPEVRDAIWSRTVRSELASGDLIFLGGHPGDGRVRLIRSGFVRMAGRDRHGKEATVDVLGPGDLLGLTPYLAGKPEPCDAIAVTGTTLYSFRAHDVLDALMAEPKAAQALMRQIMSSRRRALVAAVERSTGTVQTRVADCLMKLTYRSGLVRKGPNLSQRELAELAGASRERVNKEMTRLRRAGIIDYGGEGLRINRPDLLERLRCGEPAGGSSPSGAAGDLIRLRPKTGI